MVARIKSGKSYISDMKSQMNEFLGDMFRVYLGNDIPENNGVITVEEYNGDIKTRFIQVTLDVSKLHDLKLGTRSNKTGVTDNIVEDIATPIENVFTESENEPKDGTVTKIEYPKGKGRTKLESVTITFPAKSYGHNDYKIAVDAIKAARISEATEAIYRAIGISDNGDNAEYHIQQEKATLPQLTEMVFANVLNIINQRSFTAEEKKGLVREAAHAITEHIINPATNSMIRNINSQLGGSIDITM